jgi:hypothetical protein
MLAALSFSVHAFLREPQGQFIDLEIFGNSAAEATAINESGGKNLDGYRS